MAVSTILSPGAKVGGKYEVVEVIGFGGMGVVYKVREQVGAVSRIRALKTVLPQFASDAAVVARFRQEAEKMCMLEHENIVPVLSYSEEGEFPYLVMPFIEGQTLKDYLASYSAEHKSGLPLSEVMQIGLELARGLEIAHRFVNPESQRPQPMVHRDIKPGNIMVRVSNQSGERSLKVLIMDFGIAKLLSDQDTGHSLTEVIGTVKYASPEQIRRGKDIDPRADIYSLGMVLYELYAGRHMFTGMTEHGVLMRMVQRDLQDFEIPFPEGTPDRFRQLIERCVAVDREKRFANVAELRSLMRRILEEDSELVATEARQARDLARDERARALERGAGEFAAQPLAEGDDLIAQGDAAIADDRPKHAIPMLRAAAEVFARAAQEAVEGRERARLRSGLADLGKLQAAAAKVDAERLAPQAAAAALAAMRTLEGAIDSGNLTLGGRALAQAEQAWREATSHATQERARLAAVADCERLEAALAKIRAEIARLPERLYSAPELAELGVVEARVTNARDALAAADFAGASSSAASGLATLAEVDTRRIELLARTIDELSHRLETHLATVESSTDVQLAAPLQAEVREKADAARRLAGQRDAGAVAAIENALLAVQRLEAEVGARVAERDRAFAAAERNRKAEPAARRAFDALQQARDALAAAGAPTATEAADLAGAIAQADSASRQMEQGEYAEASPSLHAAAERLAALAAAIAERVERERQLARLAELRNEAIIKSKTLGALGAAALEAPESKRLLSTLTSAEEHAAKGESAAAIRILERALPELDGRIAQAQSEIERARRRSEATTARTRAAQAFEAARSHGDRAAAASRYATARADFERGKRALAAEDFSEATAAYNAAAQAFAALVIEIESALRAERLEALARRRAVLAPKVSALPRRRPFRRRCKEIVKSLAAADTALRDGVEQEAGRRIAETESLVNTLLHEVEAQEGESRLVGPPRALPWNAISIGGGVAAIGIVATLTFFARRSPPHPLEEARAKPTAIVEPTMAPPLVTPPPLRPTSLPTLAPTAAPTAVPTAVATAIPTAAATVAPTVVATPVPEPLSLAEARPASRVVKLSIGNEARFDASLKNGSDDLIEWRLGGETVGRGSTFVIHQELTAAPGKKRLEIFAGRDHPRTPLRAWEVDIEAPPLGFAALEPSSQTVERSSGSRVSFRAPVKAMEGEKLAFLWEVNGKPAEEADGPTYDFQPQGPGEYVVQVRATAPWGASIANKWTLSVRPAPVPTPNVREDTTKTDPRAEAQAWIEAYCVAFQKKDTDTLIALGHLSSQDEAARLREALSSMGDLKVSCSNPSVRVNGDQAIVSFDRTDRWTDPRGTPMERALPRITKTLHKTNGRWIAVP
jgi:hypothetical protein